MLLSTMCGVCRAVSPCPAYHYPIPVEDPAALSDGASKAAEYQLIEEDRVIGFSPAASGGIGRHDVCQRPAPETIGGPDAI